MNRPLTQLQLRLIDKRVIQVYQSIEELPIKDTKRSNLQNIETLHRKG